MPELPYRLVNRFWMISARPKVSSRLYRWLSWAIGRSRKRSRAQPNRPTSTGTRTSAVQ
ncbi:hypothetical protein D3C81_2162780 [compost metagenome]